MSTFAAKVAGRGGGAGPQAAPTKSLPAKQTVGFSVASPDRLAFIGNVLIGYKVELQVASGVVYEGVFGSLLTDSAGPSIVLKYAKVVRDPNASSTDRSALAEKPVPVLTVSAAELVQVFAKDVRLSPEDLSGADRSDFGFETDAAISRGRGGGVRELQRWQPDEGDDSSFFNLESASDSMGWDQFAVNRERFGVQTTWNEHFYTTKIKREECRITDAEAERIAREIETGAGAGTSNIHLLEERGGELGAEVDEEALYGAVIRDHPPAPGAYVPPHAQPHRQQQQRAARVPQQSAADRAVAWGRVGSGVAAVAGGLAVAAQQQKQQHQQHGVPAGAKAGPAPAPVPVPAPMPSGAGAAAAGAESGSGGGSAGGSAGGATAPIDIDPRKEVNKVRSSLTVGPKKDRSSPYGTPKLGMSRSPVFASPLVADPVSFSALDLDPGAPQVKLDPEAHAEFLRFKEEMNKKRLGQMGAEAALADLKKASSSFKDRSTSSTGNGLATTAAGAEPSPAAPQGTPAAAAADGAAAAAPAASSPAAPAPAAIAALAPAAAAPAAPAAAAAASGEEARPKVVSKLNPNAKPFSLNINAKEFVPSFAAKPATAAAAPAAPSASTAATATASAAAAAASAAAAAAANAANNANAAAAPPAAAAAAAQAATVMASSSQASYLTSSGPHGLTVTYHHTSAGHGGHGHGGPQGITIAQQTQFSHSAQGAMHAAHGHGHGGVHHERGYGAGSGGPMGRELREHGGVYHRGGDPYRGGGGGGGGGEGGGYRGGGGGGGEHFRNAAGSGSGDGFHHHHHHQHHKAGGGPGEHHPGKGPDGHVPPSSGLHKVPPPPPQGPLSAEGHMPPTMIMNGVAPAAMTPHGIVPMTPAMAAGMPTMGAVPYGVVMAGPPAGYMTSAMPPGTVAMASTPGGPVPIMAYAVRPAGGGPAMAMAAPGMAMMGTAMAGAPYGAAVGPYMAAPPGAMPPPSPTGRPPSTGFFQPAGAYPMIAAPHPGGPHAHPGGPMPGQPGGHMGGHHMVPGPGHGHGHGPHGAMAPHMQDGRGPGGMGPGGPKGGRQGGGGGHRPPRMDHDRAGPGPRDME